MKLIDKIKKALIKKESKIVVRGEISGTSWAEVRMTTFLGEPITLGTPINQVKIRIQALTSVANGFTQQNYRIDNCHNFLHQHSGASLIIPMQDKTMSGALVALFGEDYKGLENANS